jgi:hypothetical protein
VGNGAAAGRRLAVVKELQQAQDKHGLGLRKSWQQFKDDWPRRARTVDGVVAESRVSVTGSVVGGQLLPALDPKAPNDRRLFNLETHAANTLRQIDRLDRVAAQDRAGSQDALTSESQKNAQALAELRDEAKTGDEQGLPFSFFGAACLLLGVVLASISTDLQRWFAWPLVN